MTIAWNTIHCSSGHMELPRNILLSLRDERLAQYGRAIWLFLAVAAAGMLSLILFLGWALL
jgi:hypothetical protein